jgi:hypothetical protein
MDATTFGVILIIGLPVVVALAAYGLARSAL